MAYLLGIDIGTSGTKTVLFDEAGNTVTSAMEEYSLYQPEIGWAEQEPEDWWQAVAAGIRKVLLESGIKPDDISGIGLSGQMHGLVMMGANNQVLRRSIIWCDQRSTKECEQITSLVGEKRLIEITANPALTGFTASKIMWVKNNQPEIFEKTAKIMLPKDYVRFRLTGELATEVSDASGMQLMDIPGRCWSTEVLEKLGIDIECLPQLYESHEISGEVSSQAASETGLSAGTPVVGGGGDQAAGAVGNGIVKPGVVSATIGTSGVVFACLDKISIDTCGRVHTFCHAVPDTWHVMGVTQSAGLSLKWFRDNFCNEEMNVAELMGIDPYVLMDQQAEKSVAGSNGLIYLPYLMGERTPHLDAYAKGVFFGLSAKHDKRDITRAIMEGVAYSLRDCLEIIYEMGIEVNEIRASGGGGKSRLWKQMLADIFGKGISTINSSEGPALGAALLAGVGTGIYNSVAQACDTAIKVNNVQYPDMERYSDYSKFYSIYGRLYQSVKEHYKELSDIMKDVYGDGI